MPRNTIKVDKAREYRDNHGLEMPTLALARILYKENNLLFSNVEEARTTLRYIEGKMGKTRIDHVKNTKYFKEESRPKNPYNLPNSDEAIYTQYKLKAKRVLLLSDIHLPYHSIAALTAAFDFAKKEKPDCVLLNGDTLDFFGLSRFVKDPTKRKFAQELETFKEFFQILRKNFPEAKIVFKTGNHEERYEQFLFQKAKELVGVTEFDLKSIINARSEGVDFVTDKRIINFYGLNIIHGHEFSTGFFSPVNVARGLFLRGKTSAIQGHSHQTSEHTESNMNGKITTTWSTGCLCELHPAYAPINKWNWGFAMIDAAPDGFDVRNKRIFKSKVF